MKQDHLVSNLYGLLRPQGTTEPQHPGPDEVIKLDAAKDLHVSAGPEDEFEPDWGAGPVSLLPPIISAGPMGPPTVARHWLPRGACCALTSAAS